MVIRDKEIVAEIKLVINALQWNPADYTYIKLSSRLVYVTERKLE